MLIRASLLSLAAALSAAPAAWAQKRNLYTPPTPQSQQQQQQQQQPVESPPPPPQSYPVLSSSPYVGGSSGFVPSYASVNYGSGDGGGGGGWGYPYRGYGIGSLGGGYQSGAALQGIAAYNQSMGNYEIQIQQARILKEQSRQMQIDTARQKLMWEMEYYEKYRPTAPKMKKEQDAVDLDWARNHAQSTEIWSGRTLNILLQNILKSPSAASGPTVALDDKQLAGLNLTDGTTRGNLALAKDQGKITWPEALQEATFDAPRDNFEKSFAQAVKAAESGVQPDLKLLRGMRADLKKLEEKLKDNVKEIDPSRYIEAKRLINQLNDTMKGFSDKRMLTSFKSDWRKDVRTVADLVAYCQKNGLQFGPATAAGDYPCYTSTYYALRNYEHGLPK
jgi:hypothetical protein